MVLNVTVKITRTRMVGFTCFKVNKELQTLGTTFETLNVPLSLAEKYNAKLEYSNHIVFLFVAASICTWLLFYQTKFFLFIFMYVVCVCMYACEFSQLHCYFCESY